MGDASFGTAYGVLIKELTLLARTVFLLDGKGDAQSIQLAQELTNEPDDEAVLSALKKWIGGGEEK
ncbi:MAG: hypothetical protein A2169_09050 [Deltaproteobacteria bacterium RBG_13_47_9]|nr:MAG: hypothetical protein A2169_09050 [Deltaproteobacteria bacterium RBG_13_47_9]